MTEEEVIAAAGAAFERRDRIAAEMQAVDAEIGGLLREYTQAKRMWGFTPLMLRRAVIARMQ
jgi:hypothetical protein